MTITRGVSKDFADAFGKSELYQFYERHLDELIIGVRNNYLNLYYNCDRIAKITYTKGSICCSLDKYYIDGRHYSSSDKEKRYKAEPNEIINKYDVIKKHSNNKSTPEKKAQSKLVILNNQSEDSNWFCIDVEYVKQFNDQKEKSEAKFNGRFDIIAVSKEKPHRVALIELKYGGGAIGGSSGIYKHVDDFIKFCEKDFFEGHLKKEIIDIIKSQKDIGIDIPFEVFEDDELLSPEFYFITLNNNPKNKNATTPKQTMAGYLFKEKRWGCRQLSTKYCVETDFGDITKKTNKFYATFLFSAETLKNIRIKDIIDGVYDERIIPS